MNELRLEIVFANPLTIAHAAPPAIRSFLTLRYGQFELTLEGNHVMYTLPVTHYVDMQVSYVDAKGNPATIDGEVKWASSDEAILTIRADDTDDTKASALPVGPIGQVQITATCDADLGSGVRELITTADISVVGGEAVAGSIQPVGEPKPQ